jgi:hypothetical protein
MRQITTGVSLLALMFLLVEPAFAQRAGVPGRRVGGGSRLTQPQPERSLFFPKLSDRRSL